MVEIKNDREKAEAGCREEVCIIEKKRRTLHRRKEER